MPILQWLHYCTRLVAIRERAQWRRFALGLPLTLTLSQTVTMATRETLNSELQDEQGSLSRKH